MVLKAQSMKRCSDLYCKNGYEKGACPCGQAPFMVFRKPLGLSELYCGELKKSLKQSVLYSAKHFGCNRHEQQADEEGNYNEYSCIFYCSLHRYMARTEEQR